MRGRQTLLAPPVPTSPSSFSSKTPNYSWAHGHAAQSYISQLPLWLDAAMGVSSDLQDVS